MTPPRVVTRGMGVGGRFRGASGTPPPTVCPGTDGNGSLPLIRPCGATFPQGGRQGLQFLPGCWRQREPPRGVGGAAPYGLPGEGRQRKVAAGWGHPALRMGIWKRPRGLRGHPFPDRRAVGAGHARPGGLRRPPSMVRSVGRGLDPSAGGCPGDGRWREVSRGVGDAAPYGLPGNGRQREPAPHPALRGHLPPRGKARAVVGSRGRLPLPRQLVLGAELEGQAVVPAV